MVRHFLAVALLALVAATAQAQNKCSATGVMAGEAFTANNCAAAVYLAEKSVTLWFSETPFTPRELESFQASSYVESTKAGKDRTMLLVEFCPGGGQAAASEAAIKSIDLSMSHAKSPKAEGQWVVEAPRDFKVEAIAGDVKLGGRLSGRIIGSHKSDGQPYTWDIAFDLALPAKKASAGGTCGK